MKEPYHTPANPSAAMNSSAIPLHRSSFFVGLLVASMLALAACDSNGGGNTDAVVGVYEFTRFQFDPNSSAFTTIDMLNELEAAEIEFFSDGTYSLRYRFEGGESSRILRGNFARDGQDVRLSGEDNDAGQYQAVLLPRRFELRIEDGDQVNGLTADFSHAFPAAALRDYRPEEYEGVSGEVNGEVQLTLERRF